MPSDLAPISTTTWVAVIFSTVPLMTLSSRAASSRLGGETLERGGEVFGG